MANTYFADWEFRAASTRAPTRAELDKRPRWRAVLDPARAWYGGPVRLTSWVRAWDRGDHGTGDAVDLQPVTGTEADIRQLAEWIAATHYPERVGKVIYEPPEAHQHRGHVHVSFNPGPSGGLWIETAPKEYVSADIPAEPPARIAAFGGAVALMVYGFAAWAFWPTLRLYLKG